MADDYMMLCHGCWVELMELRRMVLDELPTVEDGFQGAYVALTVGDLEMVKRFAAGIIPHYPEDHPYGTPVDLRVVNEREGGPGIGPL